MQNAQRVAEVHAAIIEGNGIDTGVMERAVGLSRQLLARHVECLRTGIDASQ
jgi:hypothetical protein